MNMLYILKFIAITKYRYHYFYSMSAHRAINNKANHFYSATKMMVKSLTEGIRCELRSTRSNIRISVGKLNLFHVTRYKYKFDLL